MFQADVSTEHVLGCDQNPKSRDPVRGPKVAQTLFQGGYGPYQPNLGSFPVGRNGRRFRKTWYAQFSWLEYSEVLDRAFCFPCRLFGQVGQHDQSFVSKGFHKWKDALEKFRAHQSSVSHKAAFARWKAGQEVQKDPNKHILAQLDSSHRDEVAKNQQYLKEIITTLVFLARQGVAFRGHRETEKSHNKGNFLELLDLRSKDNVVIQRFYSNREKYSTYTDHKIQNKLLELAAESITNRILDGIKDAGVFALILDETQDIS